MSGVLGDSAQDKTRSSKPPYLNSFYSSHLVTLTSAEEHAWVGANVGWANLWVGGYQDRSAPDYSEPDGGWRWVTGEPFEYTFWGDGEPSDSTLNGEHWMSVFSTGRWNDNQERWTYFPGNDGYIAEFE